MLEKPTIVYCATHSKYLSEVTISIDSVRKIYPAIEIILFTSIQEYSNPKLNEILYIDNPTFSFEDKINSMLNIERQKILFLDCDTYLLEPIDDLIALLNRFELAISLATFSESCSLVDIPDAFPELNTGVILLNKNLRTNHFLESWKSKNKDLLSRCTLEESISDQPSFRYCLFNSDIKFCILKAEYNFRFNLGALATSKVRILHGRDKNIHKIARQISVLNKKFDHKNFHSWHIKIKKYTLVTAIQLFIRGIISRMNIL